MNEWMMDEWMQGGVDGWMDRCIDDGWMTISVHMNV